MSDTAKTTKHYWAEACNRRIGNKEQAFAFRPVSVCSGVFFGYYSTDNPDEQVILDALVKDPASGVTELDEKTANARLKKPAKSTAGGEVILTPSPEAKARLKEKPVSVVVVDTAPKTEDLPPADEAVTVAQVAEPQPPVPVGVKSRRKNTPATFTAPPPVE